MGGLLLFDFIEFGSHTGNGGIYHILKLYCFSLSVLKFINEYPIDGISAFNTSMWSNRVVRFYSMILIKITHVIRTYIVYKRFNCPPNVVRDDSVCEIFIKHVLLVRVCVCVCFVSFSLNLSWTNYDSHMNRAIGFYFEISILYLTWCCYLVVLWPNPSSAVNSVLLLSWHNHLMTRNWQKIY